MVWWILNCIWHQPCLQRCNCQLSGKLPSAKSTNFLQWSSPQYYQLKNPQYYQLKENPQYYQLKENPQYCQRVATNPCIRKSVPASTAQPLNPSINVRQMCVCELRMNALQYQNINIKYLISISYQSFQPHCIGH